MIATGPVGGLELLLNGVIAASAAIGAVAAGVWAIFVYRRERAGETRLSIELKSQVMRDIDAGRLVFVEVVLSNIGKTKLAARRRVTADEARSLDEPVRFSCGLRLKRIPDNVIPGAVLGWFSEQGCTPVSLAERTGPTEEINLLGEYTYDTGDVDHWLEPGEVYTQGQAIVLEAGNYLAKVTFIGSRPDLSEFWSRTFCLTV